MVQNWSHLETAKQWDRSGHTRNPVRPEQLDLLVTLLAGLYREDCSILDLGYGSGQVEQLIFERIPHAQVVGVDNSDAMMQLAAERLNVSAPQFTSIKHDLARLNSLELPPRKYQFVIAIQSLHHLMHEQVPAVYQRIYDILEPGGCFLLLDRLRVKAPELWPLFQQVWQRQDAIYDSKVVPHEGENFQDHEAVVKDRGDFPADVAAHLEWLQASGFEAACLHVHGNRGLIAGVKPTSAE
jgi:tRNA (cmo5U34)-methyltransferase